MQPTDVQYTPLLIHDMHQACNATLAKPSLGYLLLILLIAGRWPSGKLSSSWPEGSRFETRFHRRPGLLHVKADVVGQTSSRWCGAEPRRGCASPGVALSKLTMFAPK
ncbi:hypothetical protein AVEN_185219-1 [Araneus ventricosus]|uniref:Uncharacterized protein n=1 Tax=Araneus ventricosus TaxID=182803 RepID=A0A4Y2V1P3_ARAVE|nr:hypothetical protein AVEN_185219-1 [Araneus ventricosus]